MACCSLDLFAVYAILKLVETWARPGVYADSARRAWAVEVRERRMQTPCCRECCKRGRFGAHRSPRCRKPLGQHRAPVDACSLPRIAKQLRVLDVGGITFGNLAKLYGWKYASVDIEASLSTGNGGHMQHADLFYDGRNLPFGEDSFDIVILSFVLHHAAENTLPLLRQVRAIATSFVIIGEDLMTLEHHPDWLRRLYDHQPGGLYRSDEEWRTLFCLHDLRHVSTHRIRNHQDMGDPVSEAVIASKTEEWFQERPLRALYLLRSDTGSGAPRSCPDETPATAFSSNTAAARAATVDGKVNLNIVDTMGKMSSYHLETTEATANGK